ncbi:hypothetical protein MBSD_n2155 [Mizugakiibacter sediminis]|uniref:Holin n=1 Tax=Mizugakiibacter sediminis TaxID=1475481 RepID=A0A0K8QPL9_9GAMM|nr:hypothetical protein [Mizugakiibacter sediminis]GAP66840.1 hypothetical protein MBSD_n2155 [Mizugakiibacter sediminis]
MNSRERFDRFWAAVKPWVLLRIQQPSTWAGLLLKVGAIAGFVVTDSTASHIGELLAVIAGGLLVAYNQGGGHEPPHS